MCKSQEFRDLHKEITDILRKLRTKQQNETILMAFDSILEFINYLKEEVKKRGK
jgi:hypothetical protein